MPLPLAYARGALYGRSHIFKPFLITIVIIVFCLAAIGGARRRFRASSATEAVAASALASALEGFKRLRTTADVAEAAGRASEHLQSFVGSRRYYTSGKRRSR